MGFAIYLFPRYCGGAILVLRSGSTTMTNDTTSMQMIVREPSGVAG